MDTPGPALMEKRIPPVIGFFAVCSALLGVVAHLWAGWEDEHRIVLRPVGHLTLLVALVWLFTAVIALTSIAIERQRRTCAFFSLFLAAVGLFLLLSR